MVSAEAPTVENTRRGGRKPGAKTYSAPFVAFATASGLADTFRRLDAAYADFKKEASADKRLARQVAGKSRAEIERLLLDAEKRVRILKEAVRGVPKT